MPYLRLDPSIAAAAPAISFGAPEFASQHPGGKSLLSMRTRLKLELGARTDIPDALWNEWINDGYQDIFASLDLPDAKRSFYITTVASQPLYLLPASVESVQNVSVIDPTDNTDGLNFDKIDRETYRKLPPSCGTPEAWFREQNILVLWATPDTAYTVTVDATLRPSPLTADDHFPAIADKWHELVLKSAKTRGWEAVQNDTKAALVENSVARQVQRKIDSDVRDDANLYPSLRPVRSWSEISNIRARATRVEPGE